MALTPTHRSVSPYVLHFHDQTLVLGHPHFLQEVDDRLGEEGYETQLTYRDQSQPLDPSGLALENFAEVLGQLGTAREPEELTSVSAPCPQSKFWSAMYARSFKQAPQVREDEDLYVPRLPAWLEVAGTWVLDPIAPSTEETGGSAGWVQVRGRTLGGCALGLFQLTGPESFWVLGSPPDLAQLAQLCRELSRHHRGFDRLNTFLGYDLAPTSLQLPLGCRGPLQEQLLHQGVEVETFFWV